MELLGIVNRYVVIFWSLTEEMAPWLLLGFLFAGILKSWFPESIVRKYLGRENRFAVINAAILGVPLPLCSCGVIPAGVSLYRNGADKGATTSFLISTPQTGIDSILVTYAFMGLPFALIRPITALITGIIGGTFSRLFETQEDHGEAITEVPLCEEDPPGLKQRLATVFRYGFYEMSLSIGKWLLVGLALAALLAMLVPDDFFSQWVGEGVTGMLVILALSIPLYVCSTGSIPIAAVLILKGVSPGTALVFLMAGPATNIATISLIYKQMGLKSLIIYLFSIMGGALLSGLLMDTLFPQAWFSSSMISEMYHSPTTGVISLIVAIILLLLLFNAIIPSFVRKKITGKKSESMKIIHIKVAGMSCMHCKANVEKALQPLEGVESVEADPKSGIVSVEGEISLDKVRETIEHAGYQYKGEV